MEALVCSLHSRTLTSSCFPRSFGSFRYPPTSKSASKFKLNPGFCNSLKRVSKSFTNRGVRFVVMNNGGVIVDDTDNEDKDDGFYMRKCVELARTAIGCTSPNPMVGCVIVKDGKVVGQGFHPKAGQPHAEVFALRDAGELAENATAYVSLEPCNHYGRTPPCTEALIKAKVKKVVIGMIDPNPIVASKGVERLKDAGIDVVVGVEEELCKRLNEGFIHKMLTGKPFLALRYTMSVTGHILDELGEGARGAGGYYSGLLQEYDAIIVSGSLATRSSISSSQEPGATQPLWIITATNPSLPIHIRTSSEEETSKLIVFTEKDALVELETEQKGIETVVLDHINLEAILEYCKQQGVCKVLLDFRGNVGDLEELVRNGMDHHLLQKVIAEVLPVWNTSDGVSSHLPLRNIGTGIKLKSLSPKFSYHTVVLEGYF